MLKMCARRPERTNVRDRVMTVGGLEHLNCAQTKFVKNFHNYTDHYNPIAHVSYLL